MASRAWLLIACLGLSASYAGPLFESFDSCSYLVLPAGSPDYCVEVRWNTSEATGSSVAYGKTPSMGDTASAAGLSCHHHVTLPGLEPGVEYYYRALPDGVPGSFRSFPEPGLPAGEAPFVVLGDSHVSSEAPCPGIIELAAQGQPLFLIHVGDLVETGDDEAHWSAFFAWADTVVHNAVLAPCVGNHEYPFWPFDSLFCSPGGMRYLSFDFANSHFVILDSDDDLYGQQMDWLLADLESASGQPGTDWILVFFHYPPYSSGASGSCIAVRKAWSPLFERYGVDMVFSGHDHDYERTVPINGVVYVVTGGAGGTLSPVGQSPWTAYSESAHHLCLLSLENLVLRMTAVRSDGSVMDTLVIDKSEGAQEGSVAPQAARSLLVSPRSNPVTTSASFRLGLARSDEAAVLSLLDAAGRLVRRIALPAGEIAASAFWPCEDAEGRPVPAGVYFAVLEQAGIRAGCRLVVIRP